MSAKLSFIDIRKIFYLPMVYNTYHYYYYVLLRWHVHYSYIHFTTMQKIKNVIFFFLILKFFQN